MEKKLVVNIKGKNMPKTADIKKRIEDALIVFMTDLHCKPESIDIHSH